MTGTVDSLLAQLERDVRRPEGKGICREAHVQRVFGTPPGSPRRVHHTGGMERALAEMIDNDVYSGSPFSPPLREFQSLRSSLSKTRSASSYAGHQQQDLLHYHSTSRRGVSTERVQTLYGQLQEVDERVLRTLETARSCRRDREHQQHTQQHRRRRRLHRHGKEHTRSRSQRHLSPPPAAVLPLPPPPPPHAMVQQHVVWPPDAPVAAPPAHVVAPPALPAVPLPAVQEVRVAKKEGELLGASFTRLGVLVAVLPGGAADRAGMGAVLGMRLTHVNGRVLESYDVLRWLSSLQLRFSADPPHPQDVLPDPLSTAPDDTWGEVVAFLHNVKQVLFDDVKHASERDRNELLVQVFPDSATRRALANTMWHRLAASAATDAGPPPLTPQPLPLAPQLSIVSL